MSRLATAGINPARWHAYRFVSWRDAAVWCGRRHASKVQGGEHSRRWYNIPGQRALPPPSRFFQA
ncbi:hypothetical protein QS306_03540 [Paraburkholderia bonniea]|uniref:hypothetical protein n=1 Tax=Paraburkholderia bonniea TaxID=2152891 RepID=UPI001290B3A4|nr:hypothetical protein [Paraburkholderia bonniea]WJF90749.1 hypothetical protein QS306_03540 [Paraburkholderia bonniea]WJF94063.1 hypothetical protein QS308_03540 [Paraburkholderia bonniea]